MVMLAQAVMLAVKRTGPLRIIPELDLRKELLLYVRCLRPSSSSCGMALSIHTAHPPRRCLQPAATQGSSNSRPSLLTSMRMILS